MSTLVGHFVPSPREREKRDSRDEKEGKGRKRKMNESDGWMDGCFVYRRSILKGHIASNNFYIIS